MSLLEFERLGIDFVLSLNACSVSMSSFNAKVVKYFFSSSNVSAFCLKEVAIGAKIEHDVSNTLDRCSDAALVSKTLQCVYLTIVKPWLCVAGPKACAQRHYKRLFGCPSAHWGMKFWIQSATLPYLKIGLRSYSLRWVHFSCNHEVFIGLMPFDVMIFEFEGPLVVESIGYPSSFQ